MTNPAALLKRHDRYKSARSTTVESVWRECYDLTYPLRGSGLQGDKRTPADSTADQARIFDNTAPDGLNVLASNIMAGLTPANMRWFAVDVGHETDEERRWLDESADLLWENIHIGNFDAEAFECCLDIGAAGQFALFIDEDHEAGGLTFQQWPLAQCCFGSTRADGRIDIVHREYCLSAVQAETEFGRENLPEAMVKALDGDKGDDEFKFLHIIEPRRPYAVGARMAKNLPVASFHIAVDAKKLVRESGYHEMPVVVPRWLRVPGSVYAVGPMYAALPAVRQINALKEIELQSADLAVSGMWLAIDDGVLNPRTVKLGPRKLVVAADKDSLTPLQTGADFSLSADMAQRLQNDIRKTLMADNFPPPDAPMKTAYEWSVRVDMLRKLLGPIYGRLQAEYLQPLIERCFGLASRAGIFKPAPQSLQNRSYSVRYVSPMARAQRLDEVGAIEATFATALGWEGAGLAGTMDNLDPAKALELLVEGRGAPAGIRRDPKDVAKMRQAKQEAQQQQAAQQAGLEAQQAGMEAAAVRVAEG